MNEAAAFERVRDHARKLESLYLVTVLVDEVREEVSIEGVAGECPVALDLLNMGAIVGRACVTEIEDWGDAISLIDGATNGATEKLAFGVNETLKRSLILFSDGGKIVWGRILFGRVRRTEVIHYIPYMRRG